MQRGDVYIAELKPRSGSEQQGRRPVIVVSHDGFNEVESWRSIIVVPISSSKSKTQRGPTVVIIEKDEAGLSKQSCALCHQVTTLDRSKLGKNIGKLKTSTLCEVNEALKKAMNLS
ncbi:type II toxin-antitoxin system PemK/MazF family toxin [Candidatus Uabimicrobium amorphum]|uniref:mRNA interferase n=1 Tax=Uabimicrobium amorphum TaxID=2596890 RepID=A0A5S9IQF8_UABAM|nr:type II toxin-antitoxin system PemK/MazF family toxin [Candidatus Uabimicrobium amorphum]BBM86213.1 mRNA interferase [Candidatus Uabimicrobium amorphum]